MNKKVYIILSLSIIFMGISIFLVRESYAKYLSALNETTNISVARWRILVNNNDIRSGATASGVITPVFYSNPNIASDVIAPTSEGYFDLIIDSRDADVSFSFDLSVSVSTDSDVRDLVVTGYKINDNATVNLNNPVNPLFTQNVIRNFNSTTNTVRVFIKWDDSADASMNNQSDTLAANGTAKLDVNLTLKQIAN